MRQGRLLIVAIAAVGLLAGAGGIEVAAADPTVPGSPPGLSTGAAVARRRQPAESA
jgi:hypothetical protein